MKKIKLILFTALLALTSSCLVDDEDPAQDFIDTPRVVNFTDAQNGIIFTTASTETETFTTSVNIYSEIPNDGDMSFRYAINEAETTLSSSDYTIDTDPNQTFNIANGEEVASESFTYSVIPDNVLVGETQFLVIDLIKVSGGNVIGGKLVVTIDKCDPALQDSYIAVNGNFGGNGETVVLTALDCEGNYIASNMPPFNGEFTWTFNHNVDDDTITIYGNIGNFSNTVSGSGVVNTDGTISFTGVAVSGTGVQNYDFDLN